MKLSTLVATALIVLSMPLMAGDAISQQLVKKAEKKVPSISSKELQKMIDDAQEFIALDVREEHMREEGTFDAEEDIKVSRGVLEFDISSKIPDKKSLVIVYCRAGKSAALAAATMKEELGYTNVKYLKGGLDTWLEEGHVIFNHFGEIQLSK